jgi:ribonuclease HI
VGWTMHRRNILSSGVCFSAIPTPLNEICSILPGVAIPFRDIGSMRKLSTEPSVSLVADMEKEATILTRTMVRRMRVMDIRQELEKRNIVIENDKTKRDDLMLLLLNALPSRRPAPNELDVLSDEQISEVSVVQEYAPPETRSFHVRVREPRFEIDPTFLPERWWETYDIAKVTLDPKKTYVASVHGERKRSKARTGIGIVLRDGDNIVWMAHKFYPRQCTGHVASYCAVIFALRYTLQHFGLSDLVVQISDERVRNEICGSLLPGTNLHQILRKEVFQLQAGNVAKYVTFDRFTDDYEDELRVQTLAHLALKTGSCLNFGESGNSDDTSSCFSSLSDDPLNEKDARVKTLVAEQPVLDDVIDPSRLYVLRSDASVSDDGLIAAAGWVLLNEHGQDVRRNGELLDGKHAIYEAELHALYLGLTSAQDIGIERLRCELDSLEVVKRLRYGAPFRSGSAELWHKTFDLMNEFESCSLQHIPRDFNSLADMLCRRGKNCTLAVDARRKCHELTFVLAFCEAISTAKSHEKIAISPENVDFRSILSDVWCETYDIAKVNVDSEKSYVVTVHGQRLHRDFGIGIVLREGDKIAWMALKYYCLPLSSQEASYCAVILGLRFALLRFGLTKVVVQMADESLNVKKEIEAKLPAQKHTCQRLRKEVLKLQWGHVNNQVTFQTTGTSDDRQYEDIARTLAQEAQKAQRSFNTGECDIMDDLKRCFKSSSLDPVDEEPDKTLKSKQTDLRTHVVDPSRLYVLRTFGDTSKDCLFSGAGWVIYSDDGQEIRYGRKYLGRDVSLDEAKMNALYEGVSAAFSLGIKQVRCESDSQAMFERVQGFRDAELRKSDLVLCDTVVLLQKFHSCALECVTLGYNEKARTLCREGQNH